MTVVIPRSAFFWTDVWRVYWGKSHFRYMFDRNVRFEYTLFKLIGKWYMFLGYMFALVLLAELSHLGWPANGTLGKSANLAAISSSLSSTPIRPLYCKEL